MRLFKWNLRRRFVILQSHETEILSENGRLLWMHWTTHVNAWEVRHCVDNFVAIRRLIRQWIGPFVLRGDRVSCTSSVGAKLKLRSRQSDDVAEGCGRCADRVSLFTVWSNAFCANWQLRATWPDPANPTCERWAVMKRLRHMRTRASLKIASVIQPGRRWDSPAKLTSQIFLLTFSRNNGIFQVEGGSGGISRYTGLVITCRRRWTWTHGKAAFERPIEMGEPWK